MTYFRAELIQLIVSRSDSELEVQRYGMKKNTLTVDPIMLEDKLWMEKSVKNCRQTAEVGFLKTELQSFQFLNFEVSSIPFGFEKTDIRHFRRVSRTPNWEVRCI